MSFKNRKNEQAEAEAGFILGANKTDDEKKEIKNFNMRFTAVELELLKKEASKNRRSKQQHLKHLLWNSLESDIDPK